MYNRHPSPPLLSPPLPSPPLPYLLTLPLSPPSLSPSLSLTLPLSPPSLSLPHPPSLPHVPSPPSLTTLPPSPPHPLSPILPSPPFPPSNKFIVLSSLSKALVYMCFLRDTNKECCCSQESRQRSTRDWDVGGLFSGAQQPENTWSTLLSASGIMCEYHSLLDHNIVSCHVLGKIPFLYKLISNLSKHSG